MSFVCLINISAWLRRKIFMSLQSTSAGLACQLFCLQSQREIIIDCPQEFCIQSGIIFNNQLFKKSSLLPDCPNASSTKSERSKTILPFTWPRCHFWLNDLTRLQAWRIKPLRSIQSDAAHLIFTQPKKKNTDVCTGCLWLTLNSKSRFSSEGIW